LQEIGTGEDPIPVLSVLSVLISEKVFRKKKSLDNFIQAKNNKREI